ncbi:MAG: hypothetical protein U5N53_12160, partial [Mycobacterium sp.]|nr:hypothetical protein [Mycobacterium sp.]
AQRTAACLQCDGFGRVRAGVTKDGTPTYRAALCRHENPDQPSLPLDVAHGRVQDALDSYPPDSWSLSETAAVATFLRTLPGHAPKATADDSDPHAPIAYLPI